MAFKIIKGFFTIITLVKGFTGGTAKLTDAVGVPAFAMRTLNGFIRRE